MVHIGSNPPELEDIFAELEAGDIVTHCFNGKPNGILDAYGNIKDFVKKAYERGIHFDIGHGTDSFNFNVARKALKENIKAQSISTDIYFRNRKGGPVYDLSTTLSKLLKIGYSLEEIITSVTTVPADAFRLNKGKLALGYDGDLTLFEVTCKKQELVDSNGNIEECEEIIRPIACAVAGKIYYSLSQREDEKR